MKGTIAQKDPFQLMKVSHPLHKLASASFVLCKDSIASMKPASQMAVGMNTVGDT